MNKANEIIFSNLSQAQDLQKKRIFVFTGNDTLDWLYKHLDNFVLAGVACCGNVSASSDDKVVMFPTGLGKHNFLLPEAAVEFVKDNNIDEIYILPDAGEPVWVSLLTWWKKGIKRYHAVSFNHLRTVDVKKELVRKLPLGFYHLTRRLPHPIHSFFYNKIGKGLHNQLCTLLPDNDVHTPDGKVCKLAQDICNDAGDTCCQESFPLDSARIIQYIGGLGPGGAERQLCNLSRALKTEGVDVDVLCTYELAGHSGHYCNILNDCGILTRMAGEKDFKDLDKLITSHNSASRRAMLQHAPPRIAPQVYSLYAELVEKNAQILHCWLDQPNIMGGIAGYLAQVPAIFLSTRNVNPSWFPRFNEPYFKEWYKVFTQSDRFIWLANSKAGAEDYATWLDMDPDKFRIIRNGVDFGHISADMQDAQSFRKEENINPDAPLILGAFRLDEEKRPKDFLETVRKLKSQVPNVVACIAGVGEMDDDIKRQVNRMGLKDTVKLLGRRSDIYRIMKSSDVLLLTSEHEGTPNVLLEAQHLETPVVATKAGGSPEAMVHEKTGFICDIGDTDALATAVATILKNSDLGKTMGQSGKAFVDEYYSLNRMIQDTKAVYQEVLNSIENTRH